MTSPEDSLKLLQKYCEDSQYRGYDPYDALLSPIFKYGFLKSNKWIRFCAQQFVKRFPINLRPLLNVPKGYNPVSIGLFIQGYAYLSEIQKSSSKSYLENIETLIIDLRERIPEGFSGVCWGYDFDWEARRAKIPAYSPTVVATGIIINGLYEAWRITKIESLKKLIVDSSAFVLEDLNRSYDGQNFCFSYSPSDYQKVFNASMKGARLLAQVYSITREQKLAETAKMAIDFVVNHQQKDGSWHYSLAAEGGWIDNYHTGYVLDCLHEYVKLTNDRDYDLALQKGYHFYRNHFITREGMPKFYSLKEFPVDCTAAGQTLLTLCRFGDYELADKVASYMTQNMQAKNGGFYFRKFRLFTEKTIFMRWSNAWMFVGLSYLQFAKNRRN